MLLPVSLWLRTPAIVAGAPDPFYLLSMSFIGLLSIAMIYVEASRASFSLHLVHWIFVYVFFCAIPLVQYKSGIFPWGRLTSFDTDTLLLANLAILVWSITWIVARLSHRVRLSCKVALVGPRISFSGVLVSLSLSVFATVYLLWALGFETLLVRGSYADALGAAFNTSSTRLVFDRLLRSLPVAAVAGALWLLYSKKRWPLSTRLMLAVVSMVLLLVADFPLGVPRYLGGVVYLGLLLIILGKRWRTGWPFTFVVIVALLVLFPLLATTRNASTFSQIVSSVSDTQLLTRQWTGGDYDAYAMVNYTLRYISHEPGVSYGRQLLGPLFFFVPRSTWPDKPEGSGFTVAVAEGLVFTNVSSPPVAEGLINFGWPGVILFAFALSRLFGTLDASFKRAKSEKEHTIVWVLYPFWVGFAVFLLRGDLLSSTAYVIAFSFAFVPLVLRFPTLLESHHKRVATYRRVASTRSAGESRRKSIG